MVQKIQFKRNLYVADLIERYLKKRPDAMDSFEGIHAWWLKQAKREESVNTVSEALDMLVDHGVVEVVEKDLYKYALKSE